MSREPIRRFRQMMMVGIRGCFTSLLIAMNAWRITVSSRYLCAGIPIPKFLYVETGATMRDTIEVAMSYYFCSLMLFGEVAQQSVQSDLLVFRKVVFSLVGFSLPSADQADAE